MEYKWDWDELTSKAETPPGLMAQKLLTMLVEKDPEGGFEVAREYADVFALVGTEMNELPMERVMEARAALFKGLDKASPSGHKFVIVSHTMTDAYGALLDYQVAFAWLEIPKGDDVVADGTGNPDALS